MSNTVFTFVLALSYVLGVTAESHTVRFVNNCGRGTPQLIQGGNVLSTGGDFVSNGPINSAIAYLQDGNCLFNGEHCTLLEMNMNNPACAGCGSSTDISLISPHAFNVGASFQYFGGDGNTCDGLGAVCNSASCDTAFFQPDDTFVQRACQSDNVGLLITFCPSGSTGFTKAVTGSLSGETSGGSGSSGSSSKAASASSSTPAAAHSSSPAASKPSSTAKSFSSSAAVPVNVGAASTVASETPVSTSSAATSASTKTCSRRKLAKRSPSSTPESKRAHRRSQGLARGFTHKKF